VTLVIRDAVADDVEGIARVHVQAWRETYRDILSPEALAALSVAERAQMWQGAFRHPDPRAKLLVAEEDGAIVGFACGGPIHESGLLGTQAEVFAIYLLDGVKGRGLGRRLMAGVFDHLANHGIGSVGLWVLKENEPARRFYERQGGQAGPEQSLDIKGQRVMEIAYRFERPAAPS